jgi:ABC-2 type transport system ATP-binding protein
MKVIFLEDHMDIVEVKNICKTYQAFQMKDVSFSLEEGRITGFIERNGAGKSTAIKAMLNLIHTDSGKIFYFGMPLAGNEAKIKQRIGYSTGAVSWFPRKTIKKIVSTTNNVSKLRYGIGCRPSKRSS